MILGHFMKDYEQIEDFLQILDLINLEYPLNRTRGWAASADFIKIVYRYILKKIREKEKITIVECGSGISTVLISYLLKKYSPKSKFYTLEHSIDYANLTLQELNNHNLSKYNKLYFAPLIKYKLEDKIWYWYDKSELIKDLENNIDILIIDGPPLVTQKNARYPAVTLLKNFLKKESVIILDDANRADEKEIVKRWKKELKEYEENFYETEKGTSVLILKEFSYKPKVSISIPTYNRKEYLLESIESALNQNYENFEIIVVDDGSDYDVEIFIRENFSNPKIRIFKNEKNMGRPFTRNRCIKESSGDYILWLDDDDILKEDTLVNYINLINRYKDIDIIYGKLKVLNQNKLFIDPIDFYKNNKQLANFFITNGCAIPNPGTLVKKELYEKFGNYDKHFLRAQDFEFWSRVALYCNFKKCEDIVVDYRIHEDNISVGDVTSFDSSYESLIIRKMINEKNINDIFYYDNDIYDVQKELSSSLLQYLDFLNSIFYSFNESIERNDDKEISRKIVLALKADNLKVANYLVKYLQCEKKLYEDMIKKYEKLRKRFFKYLNMEKYNLIEESLETLFKFLQYSWLYFYLKAFTCMKKRDLKNANKYIRSSFIINPYSKLTKEAVESFGLNIDNFKEIENRIISSINYLEKDKKEFIEKFWK